MGPAGHERAALAGLDLSAQQKDQIKAATEKLVELLTSNTTLTRQDKELTEQVAGLTREIHAQLVKKD